MRPLSNVSRPPPLPARGYGGSFSGSEVALNVPISKIPHF